MLIEITGVNGAGKSTIKNKMILSYKGALLDDSSVLMYERFSSRVIHFFIGFMFFLELSSPINA